MVSHTAETVGKYSQKFRKGTFICQRYVYAHTHVYVVDLPTELRCKTTGHIYGRMVPVTSRGETSVQNKVAHFFTNVGNAQNFGSAINVTFNI